MDDPTKEGNGEEKADVKEAWQDVGKQFQVLGESLAQAIRTAWNDENNRRRAEEMRTGLEAMITEVGQAIRETANSPEGQQARAAAEKTADRLVETGERTVQEMRPHLMSALQQVNEELQRFIEKMDRERSEPPPTEPPPGNA